MSRDKNKTRYSDAELEEFQALIKEKLAKANEQLEFYQAQLTELAEQGDARIKALDDGVGTSESERLINLVSRTKKHISHLENALLRVNNKVYGVCRKTGKLIAKERLRAVPHATLSIEAKQNRKR
ncbi:MAG: TraR/DksA family transcriptional regulator [Saprospirales bacterium]|nr:MAG: TraR/DksA family transcriptional regulator [Saprospirales bacterium]